MRITEKVRACTGLFHKTGGCWGLLLPSYVRIERFRAGTFLGSPTALEISESNLATFFRKLRRAPMRVWSELVYEIELYFPNDNGVAVNSAGFA